MAKRCIICNKQAKYRVKDTPEYYCEECAEENFGDITLLIEVEEEEAQRLKRFLSSKMEEYEDEEETETIPKKKKEDD
ncbi:MAG: hypothetical protein WCV90_06720 [Candidatus Woesearchaeota archaeon]|jgi:hypothetical protein